MIITSKNFFSILDSYLPENPIIVEAGAFNGKDTIKMATHWPLGIIHAFEPVPAIYNELYQHTKAYSNIVIHQIALSNKLGTALFYCAQNSKKPDQLCQAGSLHKPYKRLEVSPITYPETISVPTTTLLEWALTHKVPKIDLLWLDVQGHEMAILEAAQSFLSSINLLYLEVNFIQAYEHQPTYETIHNWLSSQGFYPVAQDFVDTAQWFYGNVLYCHRNST